MQHLPGAPDRARHRILLGLAVPGGVLAAGNAQLDSSAPRSRAVLAWNVCSSVFSCQEGSWRCADSCVPTRKCQSCSCSSAFAFVEAFTPNSPVSDILACACRGSYASSLNDRSLRCTCNQPELRKIITFRAQIAEYHDNIFRLVVLV